MRLSFIGMSNIGKSYWSRRIAAYIDCQRIDCDALIEAKLAGDLVKNAVGIHDVAKWMGQPFAPHYKQTSARYMACEEQTMRDILSDTSDEDAVLDTTGSVIYMDRAILSDFRDSTRVIYLEASDRHVHDLFRSYTAHPKPVIWGDLYRPLSGEDPRETLKRCFPDLLRERAARYKALAHVTLPYALHKDHQIGNDVFLKAALS